MPRQSASVSDDERISIFRRESPVGTLGPGMRAVIWVQGCPFACGNCLVPESWDPHAGTSLGVDDLADWVLRQPGIEGVTLSGGEPMAQAAALARLIDLLRQRADLGVMCYTGYTYERLVETGRTDQQALLQRIDLLVDGLYVERLHDNLLWRGSSNQRLLPLTPRYREFIESALRVGDRTAGIEFFSDESGKIGFAGVPHTPNFRQRFAETLRSYGVHIETEDKDK